MDYKELNLKKGDLLTAAHVAHIEEGIDTVTAEVAKIKTMKIVLRNDNSENWAEVEESTILLKGEPAIEFTADGETKLKIGDGVNVWKDLPYISGGLASDIDFSKLTWGKLSNVGLTDKGSITEALGFSKIGYGDKVDIAALNTNIDLTEQYFVELNATEARVHESLQTISQTLEAQATINNEVKDALESNSAAIIATNAAFDENSKDVNTRLELVEAGTNRVDFLIGELSNGVEPTDVPLELLALRTNIHRDTFDNAAQRVDAIERDINQLKENLSDYVDITVPDGLIYEGNKLYLASKGEAISEPVEIVGGGGGGNASGGSYTITLTNLLESRFLSVTKNEQVLLKFRQRKHNKFFRQQGQRLSFPVRW